MNGKVMPDRAVLTPRFAAGVVKHYWATMVHKVWVAYYLLRYWAHPRSTDHAWSFVWRAIVHDLSKFRWDETRGFAKAVFDLKHTEFGSDAYKEAATRILPSIERHYRRNSHHPQFYPRGYEQMGDYDIVEMVADWAAAVRRHRDGDLEKSIRVNQARFGYLDEDAAELRRIAGMMGVL